MHLLEVKGPSGSQLQVQKLEHVLWQSQKKFLQLFDTPDVCHWYKKTTDNLSRERALIIKVLKTVASYRRPVLSTTFVGTHQRLQIILDFWWPQYRMVFLTLFSVPSSSEGLIFVKRRAENGCFF